jgi:hypothetical protein
MSPTQSGRSWQQSHRIQGLLFDGAMFLANLYLLQSLDSIPIERFGDRRIALLLGLAVIAQLLGAWLKKKPLQERMKARQTAVSAENEWLVGCLTFIHFIFFLVVVGMALALAGFVDLNQATGAREFAWGAISLVVAGITSGMVLLAIFGSPPADGERPAPASQEIAADILLWISAVIITRFFWTALLLEAEPPSYMGLTSRALVYIGATSALFMVFYMPTRLLFLIEDYKYPMTWLRLWLVAMLPLLALVLIPAS